jgi:outer membrane biosynthesis protein TonB
MKLNRRGLFATVIYHALLLLLLVFAGLTYLVPPPGEEGILVNFGTDNEGFGPSEPMADDQQANAAEEVNEEAVEEVDEPVSQPVEPDPSPVDNTQDVEETKVKEKPQPTPEEREKRRLEAERIERERIEREEQERIERERQQQAERLNNLGKSAFGNQGSGQTEGSEGQTEGTGNQGDINGSPDADRYGTGGGLGDGISFGGLGSRRAVGLPEPDLSECEVTSKIEVTVEIQVDRDGNVVSSFVKTATYQDPCIDKTVLIAASKSKFSVDPAADYRQTGWIKYIIEP